MTRNVLHFTIKFAQAEIVSRNVSAVKTNLAARKSTRQLNYPTITFAYINFNGTSYDFRFDT